MNKRFLRWVLSTVRRWEKQADHDDRKRFYWNDVATRWNALAVCAAFTLLFLLMLCGGFGKDKDGPFLTKIGFGGYIVYLWFITVNLWLFHRMRRKKEIQKTRQRIRWMLKVTLRVFVGTTLSCLLVFLPFWVQGTMKHNEFFISIFMPLVAPFFFTSIWIGIATTPFHFEYSKRSIQERQS